MISTAGTGTTATAGSRARRRPARMLLHAFLIAMAVLWMVPLMWALYISLRPIGDTTLHGYFSLPGALDLSNYTTAWDTAQIPGFYLNTLYIVVPSVILTLLVSSALAFAISQFKWKINLPILMLFTAGNLLPPQVIIIPLYWLYLNIPISDLISDNGLLYDQYIGIILIHVVFQAGFATFVLSNYMKTLSKEITEAALVDGANVVRIWWSVILPLCRPALAAMATLLFTWIYNDFFWALILMKSGDKRPITSALNNLQGAFFTNYNLLAAGSLLAAIPPIVIFIVLQRHFVRGLTLGATKG
jgi:multiple sugar transport system permease protein